MDYTTQSGFKMSLIFIFCTEINEKQWWPVTLEQKHATVLFAKMLDFM